MGPAVEPRGDGKGDVANGTVVLGDAAFSLEIVWKIEEGWTASLTPGHTTMISVTSAEFQ